MHVHQWVVENVNVATCEANAVQVIENLGFRALDLFSVDHGVCCGFRITHRHFEQTVWQQSDFGVIRFDTDSTQNDLRDWVASFTADVYLTS